MLVFVAYILPIYPTASLSINLLHPLSFSNTESTDTATVGDLSLSPAQPVSLNRTTLSLANVSASTLTTGPCVCDRAQFGSPRWDSCINALTRMPTDKGDDVHRDES